MPIQIPSDQQRRLSRIGNTVKPELYGCRLPKSLLLLFKLRDPAANFSLFRVHLRYPSPLKGVGKPKTGIGSRIGYPMA